MQDYEIRTTNEIKIELYAMQRWHARASMDFDRPPSMRAFHKRAAHEILQKIKNNKNAPWTWEKFIEAYKATNE